MQTKMQDLLTNDDPLPVELVQHDGQAPLVITSEHGGRAIPASLADRAPQTDDMARHIAWDIGAADVARGIARQLDAPLALQPFSRLVIDCNRPRHAGDLAPAISDGSLIPFNQNLSDAALETRWRAIHQPFHQAVATLLDRRPSPALIAVHSFTPQLRGQARRRMAIGLLARQDKTLARTLRDEVAKKRPDLEIVLDAPYRIEDSSDYTIPIHGEARRLPHVLIELRHDLIAEPAAAAAFADLLSEALRACLTHVLERT